MPMTAESRGAYGAWLATIDHTPEADAARFAAQMDAAAALRQATPGLPVITSYIMAGDAQSAVAATSMLLAGVAWEHALIHVGSYARIEWMLDTMTAGHVTPERVYAELPYQWPSADPDDTDRRLLTLWQDAWDHAGKVTILDDAEHPLPPGRRLTVYRGQGRGDAPGIAWSLSEDVARKFANGASVRVPGGVRDPIVFSARVHRRMVMAYLTGRNEQEVIVDPAFLR